MTSAQPSADKRVVSLPGARIRFVELVADDLWLGEDEAGAPVTIVVAEGGTPTDEPLAHGREGTEVLAVYPGAPVPLSVAFPVHAAAGICEAVAALQRRGGRHGDLRPARILVDPVRLVGAGLTGRGDPAYQPPEVALGEPIGPAADVYATAAVIYRLIAGRPPFEGKSAAEIVSAVLVREPPALDGPPEVAAAVARALAKREADRGTLFDLAEAFAPRTRKFLGAPMPAPVRAPAAPEVPESTVPIDPLPRPRPLAEPPAQAPVAPRSRPLYAFILGGAFIVAVVVWFAVRPPPPPGKTLPIGLDPSEGRIDRARQRGDLATAHSEAAAFALAHPDDPAAFVLLGHVLFSKGEKDRALAAYRAAVRMDRTFGASPELLANLRATFADPQRGEDAFRIAEDAGAPAEAILTEFSSTTASASLKRRAADALAHLKKGDSQ